MALYYEGYREAADAANEMDLEGLLSVLDTLYGRDNLSYGDEIEEVRAEALRQIKKNFTDTSSSEYELFQFWTEVREAQQGY